MWHVEEFIGKITWSIKLMGCETDIAGGGVAVVVVLRASVGRTTLLPSFSLQKTYSTHPAARRDAGICLSDI